jgi:hypothetical protein
MRKVLGIPLIFWLFPPVAILMMAKMYIAKIQTATELKKEEDKHE